MTDEEYASDEDIAADVLPAAVDEDAVPLPLDRLFPWHKPRKQFIRANQWIQHSERLLQKLKGTPFLQEGPSGKPEVKYLTLPGTDYLDVRALSECCGELGIHLTSTGFLEGGESNPMRARAQFREESLKQAGHITDRSITFARRFEDISSLNGQAYQEIRRRGPFHIINVDACGSIASPSAEHASRLIDAIYRMVELQFELCSSRWLLFLTADVRVENISTGTMNSLAKAIKENAQHNEEFKNDAIELLSAPDKSETVADAIDLASQKTGESFIKLFALGFSKWVLHLAKSKNWQLKMHRSYYYSTTSQSNIKPSMPCMAFEFLPPIPALEDRFDAVNAAPRTQGDGEDLSMRALKKVAEMEDLDKLMSSDMSLRDDMIAATKALLEDAGYAASTLAKLDSAWE